MTFCASGMWARCGADPRHTRKIEPENYARTNQANRRGIATRRTARITVGLSALCATTLMVSGAAFAGHAVHTSPFPAPNFAHFDHLMASAVIGDQTVGALNIYSRAPDFRPVAAPGEGYACVDDAARGLVLLSASLGAHDDEARQHQLELLTGFVLAMQNSNGYFNNFIRTDGTINTTYKTSVADLNWWSLRALWGLEAAYVRLPPDSDLAQRVTASIARLVANLERDLPVGRAESTDGRRAPDWLPAGSGADQAAVAIIGLLSYYTRTHDALARSLISAMAEGIKAMQAGDARHFPYGAHLSWRNRWHAWGSDQAYALLLAGRQLHRPDYVASGLAEVAHFYPYLLSHGYLSELVVEKTGRHYISLHAARYPQIAYGIRPMVFAADEAWRITGKTRYRTMARGLASWLTGHNAAHRALYDTASGRVLDGIEAGAKINSNSGAESTIEGLMVLQRLEEEARQ
jgi:hypothetical protein